ncbi:MAG: hypothetical protein ABMB14_14960, partial [Myxococcota bacterium]
VVVVAGAAAVLASWVWAPSAAPRVAALGVDHAPARLATLPVSERAAPAPRFTVPAPAGAVPADPQGASPVAEALAAVAAASGDPVVQCDARALGVPDAELADALAGAFPPAADVTDGVVTVVADPTRGQVATVFRDGTVRMNVAVADDGAVTGCTIALGPAFSNIQGDRTVTLDDLAETFDAQLEASAAHDRGTTPLQVALAEPTLSPAARQVLDGWVADQAVQAERAIQRAEWWTARPGQQIQLRVKTP